MTEEEIRLQIYKMFLKVEAEYLKKFGGHSLDYANYIDPRDFLDPRNYNVRELKKIINLLRKAINKNKPLPNDPPPEGVEYLY